MRGARKVRGREERDGPVEGFDDQARYHSAGERNRKTLAQVELELREARRLLRWPQVAPAKALNVTQRQVSETESRGDHRVSTLRRYVAAPDGEIEVVARFGSKRICLRIERG